MCTRKADNLLLFKSIVDCGSLSTAAKTGHISISQASKRMTHLESTLNVKLLHRSTRKLSLTLAGEELYNKLTSIKEQIDEAWQSMLEYSSEPRGKISVSCPAYYGLNDLISFTESFSKLHPEIQVNLAISNADEQTDANKFDISFQSHTLGPNQLLPDSDLCAKLVKSERLIYVASKDYLKEHGIPNTPEELQQHKCLAINNTKAKKHWTFYKGQTPIQQKIDVAFETNTFEALYRAVNANMGIAQVPAHLVENDNLNNLQVILNDYNQEQLDTYAYYHKSKLTSKKIKLLLEAIEKENPVSLKNAS